MISTHRFFYFLIALALTAGTASAQVATGIPPFGSFSGGPDVINLADLNSHITIPVVHKPGRGLNFTYDLGYESTVWSPVSSSGASVWTPDPSWGWHALSAALTGSVPIRQTWGSCFFTDPNSLLRTRIQYPTTTYTGYKDSFGTLHTATIITTPGEPNCDSPVDPVYTGSATAVDGSGYLLTVNEQANPSIIVTRPNGQLINSPGSSTATVIDPNGNQLTTSLVGSNTTFTDTLGTTVLTVAGSGTPSSPVTYTYPAPSGGNAILTVNYAAFTVQTSFGCSAADYGPASNNLVSEIDLPDGSKYIFAYETTPNDTHTPHYVTGRIQSVKLPTGGTIAYTYTGGSTGHITCADGSASGLQRSTPDTGSNYWNYARTAGTGAASTTTITDPSTEANQTVISFQGFLETQRLIYQGSTSGTLMQTVNTCYNAAASPCTGTAITFPINQRAVIFTLPGSGNLQAKHVDLINSLGLTTESDDYDFGSGAPQTTALKKTLITYASLGSNLNSYEQTLKIQDGTGATKYRQDFSYDQYTSFTGSNCITGASQHDDGGHGCSFITRANLTSVTTYTDPVTPAGGITKNFTYDSLGNLRTAQLNCCQQKTWNYSNTTHYAYPDSVTSGSGSTSLTTASTYDNNSGIVLSITDPDNLVTNLAYDIMGRIASAQPVTTPTTPATTYTYHDYDNSSSFTNWTAQVCAPVQGSNTACQKTILDSLGRSLTRQTLDGANILYSAIDAQYDVFGRAYRTRNPYTGTASYWTTTQFDVLGRVTSTTLPDNSATGYSYTDATVTVTDPTGKQRKMQSDALRRLVSVWEPDPSNSLTLQTTYAYNVLDALTSVTQGSQTRTYTYDALSRVTSTTTPEAGTVCFGSVSGSTCNTDGYDSFNNLLKRTDARGVLTSYGYDGLNRLTSIGYNVGTSGVPATSGVTFTYGTNVAQFNNGRLITMTDGAGSENYTYNNLGQLTQLQKVVGSTTYPTSYQYNLAGELTQITYPSGRSVQQNLDTIGRLSSIVGTLNSVNTTYASGFGYNSAFQATGFQYGNGLFASFGFSADRLQLSCLDYSTTNRGLNCTHDATTKFGLTYSYGSAGSNNGQIAGITDSVDSGRTVSYAYDALYRLSSAVTNGSANYVKWGLSWNYDRYGNALAETQTYDSPAHFSVSVDVITNRINTGGYAYDANGNMTNDGNNTLVYDAENRLRSATNGGASGTYTYDGNNLRVSKSSSGTTTVYIFSGSKVIAEYDNGAAPASPSREYIYSGGALLAKIDSAGTKYYHQDHLSNRLVTDASGNTSAQLGHYPFGESWYNASSDKLLFTSYERDSESGNDYAMMRYSVNRLGRFSSPDPLSGTTGNPQSLNKYAYAMNDPGNLRDPLGLDTIRLSGYCQYDEGSGTTYCFNFDGRDGGGAYPLIFLGHGGGGGGVDFAKLKAQALRAFETNPNCAPLFGGFANALNSLFGTSYNMYTAGQANPFPDRITPDVWTSVVDTFKNPTNYGYALGYPPHTAYGIIFFGNRFSSFDSGFATSAYKPTQMTGFFHELEHVANQIGAPLDVNYAVDYQKLITNCTPKPIETQTVPVTGNLTPP